MALSEFCLFVRGVRDGSWCVIHGVRVDLNPNELPQPREEKRWGMVKAGSNASVFMYLQC